MLPEEEVWRVVPSHRKYSVSSWGRVKRISTGRILVLYPYPRRYKYVRLSSGTVTTRTVHSIVAEAFIGERPIGAVVNHKNGKKLDNRPANLEYISQLENIRHSLTLRRNHYEPPCFS